MSMTGFTAFDVAVAAVVLVSALLALARGFVREVMSLLSWIGALLIAWRLYPELQPIVADTLGPGMLVQVGTALAAFLVPLILLRLGTGLLANAVAGLGLGSLDRLLGLGFGAARGALIVCAAYLVARTIVDPSEFPPTVTEAKLEPQVEAGADWLLAKLPPDLARDGLASVDDALARAQTQRTSGGAGTGYTNRDREQLDRAFEQIR